MIHRPVLPFQKHRLLLILQSCQQVYPIVSPISPRQSTREELQRMQLVKPGGRKVIGASFAQRSRTARAVPATLAGGKAYELYGL